jgi:hypothetical protein
LVQKEKEPCNLVNANKKNISQISEQMLPKNTTGKQPMQVLKGLVNIRRNLKMKSNLSSQGNQIVEVLHT